MTRFPNVEVNPDPQAGVPARCRIIFANINGLHGNLDVLAVAASHLDIVFCCETKATRRRHAAELLLPGYCGLGMVMYSRSGLAVSQFFMLECDC